MPVTEFATEEDLRFASRVPNHAACRDPRDRVLSKVMANAITASCWGTEPLTFSWLPKPPASMPPLGLVIDPRSGAITGTPQFVGEVTVCITCTDADGHAAKTELRFLSQKFPDGAVQPRQPTVKE